MTGFEATAEVDIAAPPERVWAALTDPAQVKQYFFGAEVDTDWKVGSPIEWHGEYEGKSFTDKGKVLAADPGHELRYTHFSPMAGQPDEPENYHTLDYTLTDRDGTTHVTLTQDNNGSADEAKRAEENWAGMLAGLKQVAEAS
jgi:uncharacterized protein YndB with AHSA1/START domain